MIWGRDLQLRGGGAYNGGGGGLQWKGGGMSGRWVRGGLQLKGWGACNYIKRGGGGVLAIEGGGLAMERGERVRALHGLPASWQAPPSAFWTPITRASNNAILNLWVADSMGGAAAPQPPPPRSVCRQRASPTHFHPVAASLPP